MMREPQVTDDWRPVDDAPRDGTEVRILVEVTAYWQQKEPALLIDAGWKLDLSTAKATHWRECEARGLQHD